MIEGSYPRHICIDLTHNTSQSKIFDTALTLQFACQVLLKLVFRQPIFLDRAAVELIDCQVAAELTPPLSIKYVRLLIIVTA